MLVAGMLTVFNFNGEHELRFGLGENQLEITLHHREEQRVSSHSHTTLEKLLVGESVSGDEPDHRLGFVREQLLAEEEVPIFLGPDDTAGFDFCGEKIPFFEPVLIKNAPATATPFDQGGLPPPFLMLRGIVMRI